MNQKSILKSESGTAPVPKLMSLSSSPKRSGSSILKGGITASDLLELQEAAFRLRSKCSQLEAEKELLVKKSCDYRDQILHLRTSELFLQKEVSMWSSFSRLFYQPLYETCVTLSRYQIEAQQLLIQKLIRDQKRKYACEVAESMKQKHENTALLLELRQMHEELGKAKEDNAGDKVQLRKALKDLKAAQKEMSIQQDHLTFCMNRLEESERGRVGLRRHLSEHQAALTKRRQGAVDIKWYEAEIRSRDVLIAELQRTLRGTNRLLAQQPSERLVATGDERRSSPRRFRPEEAVSSPLRETNDSYGSSEKLYRSIQRLRRHVGSEVDFPTSPRRCFFSRQFTPTRPLTSSFSSPRTENRGHSMGVDLQEFLAGELRAPLT